MMTSKHSVFTCRKPLGRTTIQYSALFLLVIAGIAVRWQYRGHYLDGWDAVDFALALHDFDLEKYQPHFPGYPIYIALAKGSQWVAGHDVMHDTDALILPGIVFGALAAIPIALLASRWTGRYSTWAGFTAAGLYLLSPGLWLQAEKPLSDALGCALLPWLLLALVHALDSNTDPRSLPWWVGIASILMGLILGIRLSYWPFVFGCAGVLLLHQPARLREAALWGCGGLAVGAALWLIPLIAHAGLSELFHQTLRFVNGHFTLWGGTVFSDDAEINRHMAWWWGIWAFSLGGYWPEAPQNIWRMAFSVSLCLLLLWAIAHKPLRPTMLVCGVWLAPYLLWILIGQNPERPRHILPLTLFLYPLAGAAVGAWMAQHANTKLKHLAPAVAAIAVICSGFIAIPLVKAYAETVPPQVLFVEHIKKNFDPDETRVFAKGTRRLFAYYAPEFDATRARGLNDVHRKVSKDDLRGTVLFSSKLGQKLSKYYCFDYLTTFRRSKYVEPWFWTVSLFSYCGIRGEGDCCEI